MSSVDVCPLQLNSLTPDTWGGFDPLVMAQLAPLANDACYTQKFYKAPADSQEVLGAYGFITCGLRITPGSIIYGIYLPCIPNTAGSPAQSFPPSFTVQVNDKSLDRDWFDEPVASIFLSNYKPTAMSKTGVQVGSFPKLLSAPYPVVGSGLFMVELQSTSASLQRVQFVLGVLEVCGGI